MEGNGTLVVVCSAGIDPWHSIEELGQRATWGEGNLHGLQILWLRKSLDKGRRASELVFRRWSDHKLRLLHHKSPKLRRREEHKICHNPPSRFFSGVARTLLDEYSKNLVATHEGETSVRTNLSHGYGLSPITTLASLIYLSKNWSFDHLVRITSTQYLRADLLAQQISELPKHRVYGGYRFSGVGGHPFMSGAFNVMSRDVVESVVSMQHKMRFDLPDDVGLGWLIEHELLADLFPLPMTTVSGINDFSGLNSTNPPALIRCRPTPKVETINPSLEVMLGLHKYLR